MTQVTWRAPEELVMRVRRAASADGRSLNEYLTRLARAATDPDLADDDLQRLRERLGRAGLLAPQAGAARTRPDPEAVASARERAGTGSSVSGLVHEGRG